MRAYCQLPLALASMPAMSPAGEELALVVASGRFDWPQVPGEPLRLSAEQPDVELCDRYYDTPQGSSLRWEGQATHARPGTDIYVYGHACAPSGYPRATLDVGVRVGHCLRRATVYGERVWLRAGERLVPSHPEPFTEMPLVYERAFGGVPSEASAATLELAHHNPVGRGLYDSPDEAEGQPLPNLDDPEAPVLRLSDRPWPVGFGPVARHWLPRRRLAGTYDQRWLETRAPLWPEDLDERLFCAAARGLCAIPHLLGNEPVVVEGLAASGPTHFHLPGVVLEAVFEFRDQAIRRAMILDAVALDGDTRSVTLIWRASVPAHAKLATLGAIEVMERRA